MESQQELFDRKVKQYFYPYDSIEPGRYIFETLPGIDGDHIRREITIVERSGELGIYMQATGNFIKVKEFRTDCSLTLIEAL